MPLARSAPAGALRPFLPILLALALEEVEVRLSHREVIPPWGGVAWLVAGGSVCWLALLS